MNGFRRALLLITMAGFALQTACMSYRPIEPTDVAGYGEVRITTTSGAREDLLAPRAIADTLIGHSAYGDTIRVPLVDIDLITVAEKDTEKTFALVAISTVGVIASAGLVYLLVGMSTTDCIGLCLDD